MIKKPEKLLNKNLISVCQVSSSFSKKIFLKKLDLLKNYKVQYSKIIFNKNYFKNHKQKALLLNKALKDKKTKCLLFARGGYGSIHVLDSINKISTKIIMAYSDLTNVLLYVYKKNKQIVFYGPNLTSAYFNNNTITYLSGSFTKPLKYKLKALNYSKNIEAPLLGGCLSVLVTLIGTKFMPSFKDHILFLEDTNEPTYKIDRYLQQLYHAGILKNIRGIIIGSFLNHEKNYKEPFIELASLLKIPVYYNLKAGHGGFNTPIPFGLKIKVSKNYLNIPYPFKK
jgi:muramoyltetrapeptide carboxypeptidase